jgi:hypothetical protein
MFGMGQMPGHSGMGQTGYQQQQVQAGMQSQMQSQMAMQALMQPQMQPQMGMGMPFNPMMANPGYNSMANGPFYNTGYGMGPMGI